MEIDPYLALVENVLGLCATVIKMAMNAKANKERCQQIAMRVRALEPLVLKIKQRGTGRISGTVKTALKELCNTLKSAKKLMEKFSQTKAFVGFWKSSSFEEKFLKVNKNLTDNLQVLSSALIIENGDTLHKVYETVSGRRQPHTRPPTPVSQPTTMPHEMTSSPTTPNPLQNSMYTMTMSSPTTPFPLQTNMPTMMMSSPTSPTSFFCNMPTMMMTSSMSSSPFSTTTIVSSPAMNMMPKAQHASVLTNYSMDFPPNNRN